MAFLKPKGSGYASEYGFGALSFGLTPAEKREKRRARLVANKIQKKSQLERVIEAKKAKLRSLNVINPMTLRKQSIELAKKRVIDLRDLERKKRYLRGARGFGQAEYTHDVPQVYPTGPVTSASFVPYGEEFLPFSHKGTFLPYQGQGVMEVPPAYTFEPEYQSMLQKTGQGTLTSPTGVTTSTTPTVQTAGFNIAGFDLKENWPILGILAIGLFVASRR